MLIDPDIVSAGVDGSGTFVTSTREMLFTPTRDGEKSRSPLALAPASWTPSEETIDMLLGKPRIRTPSVSRAP